MTDFILHTHAVTRCLALLLGGLLLKVGSVAAARPPNIVLIISDDQGYADFGFMGHEQVQTPHLDRLAAQSARYVNGYVPTSVCRPSLATLLTGLYPHQHGVHFNHPPPGFAELTRSDEITKERYDALREEAVRLVRDVPTLPRLLAAHGYRSLQTGKYWEGHYSSAGFTHGMTLAEPSSYSLGNKQLPGGDWVAHGNGDAGLSIGRQTMQPIAEFLDEHGEDPFLIWYAPFLPHTPHDSPQRFRGLYANRDVPPHQVPYLASCSQFDETCGELIRMIEERGLVDRTIFVFIIDNGWAPLNERPSATGEYPVDTRTKRSPFDFGLRTPILIRWDGHVVPATHSGLCSSIDVVPTLLHAVGLGESARELPGVNLLPSATGEETAAIAASVRGNLSG